MNRVRLRLPARLTPHAIGDLRAALVSAAGLVTIEGAPDFCEGLDVEWMVGALELDPAPMLEAFDALLRGLSTAACPVVALVDGKASGGGLALAAAADRVIATPRSSFALPEVFLGLVPAVALPWIARRTGAHRAQQLALGERPLSAETARDVGLVDEIADDLEAALAVHVSRWRRADPRALAEVKMLARALPDPDYRRVAIDRFRALVAADETRARVRRAAAGEPPWGDT